MLDVDFGSYPFVTSSNTITAGVCSGLGIAPSRIGKVYGVFKAYCTRVGSGPFPTELNDETGAKIREAGNEYGSTTGRPRRCGWLDLPSLKYAIMVNGVNSLIMMKTDVLSDFPVIRVCTEYRDQEGIMERYPYDLSEKGLEPVYKDSEGWNESLDGYISGLNLPDALEGYIRFIEKSAGLPVEMISIGPERSQILYRNL
jgi:adenylosuccinate synthase